MGRARMQVLGLGAVAEEAIVNVLQEKGEGS